MSNYEFVIIWLPLAIGGITFFFTNKLNFLSKLVCFLTIIYVFYYQILAFLNRPLEISNYFRVDYLNSFILVFIGLFTFLIFIYSLKNMREDEPLSRYFSYIILTLGASNAVVLSKNFLILLVFWGFLGITLFLLINFKRPQASDSAKKAFIIIGGSDALLLLGIAILWHLIGSFDFDKISNRLTNYPTNQLTFAFLCIVIASFAKAGAMPMHTWIPEIAQTAPLPVLAYLPASLDKLLGIYLLVRVSLDIFKIKPDSALSIFLLLIGAITIIAAVMMALIQHNLKKLLSYHAVSQVGYMVMGIGTGNPVGIAGGIFHMLNHAIYKSCLFLSGGAVEYKTKTSQLDKLGGLGKFMPLTFLSCVIASLSISGVPPFNGFFSKWMVYQGLISQFTVNSLQFTVTKFIIILCLVAAMFGSGLTLASFMKLIHATFLGQKSLESREKISKPSSLNSKLTDEVSWTMWLPQIILAGLCIMFGIFAFQIPLKYFIFPALSTYQPINLSTFLGIWSPALATILIISGILIGLIIYKLTTTKITRRDISFVGGEVLTPEVRPTGVEFYNTIKEINIFNKIYNLAERKFFDIYELTKNFVFFVTGFFQYLHNGVLPTYLVWCLIGMLILFFVLMA